MASADFDCGVSNGRRSGVAADGAPAHSTPTATRRYGLGVQGCAVQAGGHRHGVIIVSAASNNLSACPGFIAANPLQLIRARSRSLR